MKRPPHFAAVAEAPPVVVPQRVAAPLQLLDGDEVVQLSIKPSLWFIPLSSLRVVAAASVLAIGLTLVPGGDWARFALQGAMFVGFARVGLATLQWASRLYVLTNRRALRFSGIQHVRVAECALARIAQVQRDETWHESALQLGSLRLVPGSDDATTVNWETVARPSEVQELLERAVRRSQMSGSH